MRTPSESERIRVIFHGQVQGVFFRATTEQISQWFNVVGFVRNLPDGAVEVQAEGAADELPRFVAAIEERFRENITSAETSSMPATGEERSFSVRH